MKRYIIFTILIATLSIMTGCEYDVAEPLWEQDYSNPPAPVITSVEPADVAPAGINTITIYGENFAESAEDNLVYFNNVKADIISAGSTEITVYRPNLVADSAEIKVVSNDALVVAKMGPYKLNPVMERFGSFVDNNELAAIVVDTDENVYAIQFSPLIVYKVTPEGDKTILNDMGGIPYGAVMGPGDNIVIFQNKKQIFQMNTATGDSSVFAEVDKNVRFGDFDEYGNLYTAGQRSDLFVVTSGNTTGDPIDVYSRDTILWIRIFNGYVYLLVDIRSPDADNPELAIWRHEILDATGSLGNRELVLNWTETEPYLEMEAEPASFTFSADGSLYVGSDYTSPVLMVSADGSQSPLYKDILPSAASDLVWGNMNYMYMILDSDSEYNLIRIDMGAEGAPYYGR